MSLPAFFGEIEAAAGETLELGPDQAAHALALRLGRGDPAQALNGKGGIATCTVENLNKRQLILAVEKVEQIPPVKAGCIIALAMSKAVRRGFFMEKAAELGAQGIWLWQAERSVGAASEGTARACQRQLVAGALQSHNPWFPRLQVLGNVDTVIARAEESAIAWKILPWEEQERIAMLLPEQLGRPGITLFVIGPEGGLTEREATAMKNAGFTVVSLGQQILRCETAASLCLGLQRWAGQLPGRPDAA